MGIKKNMRYHKKNHKQKNGTLSVLFETILNFM